MTPSEFECREIEKVSLFNAIITFYNIETHD